MLRRQFKPRVAASGGRSWGQKFSVTPRQGLTFAVGHVSVELETDLAQAQEGAVGVDALAVEAHVVFTALVHVCENMKK